jgi:hypothetical protein
MVECLGIATRNLGWGCRAGVHVAEDRVRSLESGYRHRSIKWFFTDRPFVRLRNKEPSPLLRDNFLKWKIPTKTGFLDVVTVMNMFAKSDNIGSHILIPM